MVDARRQSNRRSELRRRTRWPGRVRARNRGYGRRPHHRNESRRSLLHCPRPRQLGGRRRALRLSALPRCQRVRAAQMNSFPNATKKKRTRVGYVTLNGSENYTNRIPREAAKEYSSGRKPWEQVWREPAPKGRKKFLIVEDFVHSPQRERNSLAHRVWGKVKQHASPIGTTQVRARTRAFRDATLPSPQHA